MKKILIITALAAISLAASAQTKLGYTNGTIGRDNVARYGTQEKQGMAFRLSHDKLQQLKGKTITAIEAVYGSRNVTGGKMRVFITDDLNATSLTETSAAISAATTKWNTTALTTPYTITGNEEQLFIGTDMSIAAGYNPLSVDYSADTKGVCFAYTDNGWEDIYGMQLGAFNIRAVFGNETFDLTDVMLKDVNLNGYFKADEQYTFDTQLLNFGTKTVNSFDVSVSIDGGEPKTTHFEGLDIAPSATYPISTTYSTSESKSGKLAISVSNVNGGGEMALEDNTVSSGIFFYPANMERALFVEEFTGMACVNCPSGKRRLDECLENTKQNTVEVLHHLGYSPDILSMDIQDAYLAFYASGSTYAPAVMINRAQVPGVTSNGNQAPGPVFDIGTLQVNHALDYCGTQMQPYASLSLATSYDPVSRDMKVSFSVYCHRDLPEGLNAINILIAQDSIIASQQGASDNYVHNRVCRGSLLGNAWGGTLPDAYTKAGSSYTWETTYNVPETIFSDYWLTQKPQYLIPTDVPNMRLVAYLAHYDNADVNNNKVYNAVEAHFGKSYTQAAFPAELAGIEEIVSGQSGVKSSSCYNLSGQRVSKDAKGIIVVNGKKFLKR